MGEEMTKNVAEELFGRVTTEHSTVSKYLTSEDLERLTFPLSIEDGESIRVFCTGHHSVFPITSEGRDELLERSGVSKPSDWGGKYFEVSGCPFCTEENTFDHPVLKDYRSS
jgi:hypothetical protein